MINNKEISYSKLKELFYLVIVSQGKLIAKNKRYSEKYKKEYIQMTNSLQNFIEFERFSKLLNSNDAKNLNIGLKATIDITDYANRNQGRLHIKSLKGSYLYKLELPFYKKENNKVSVIKYIHSGYPYDISKMNPELILTQNFFNQCTDEVLDEIIVYDFKTMKRYTIKDLETRFHYIFNILKVVDMRFIPNNSGYHCKDCQHYEYCKNDDKFKKDFKELIGETNGENKKI